MSSDKPDNVKTMEMMKEIAEESLDENAVINEQTAENHDKAEVVPDDVNIESESDKPVKVSKKGNLKKTITAIAAVLLIAGIGLLTINVIIPNKHKATIGEQIKDTELYSVSNLECNLPVSWAEKENRLSDSVIAYKSVGNDLAEVEVAYMGETLDGATEEMDFTFDGEETEVVDQGSLNIKKGTGKYSITELPNGNTVYAAPVKVDDSIFVVCYMTKTKYFDKSQPETLIDNIAFEKYVGPAIASISAEYKGSTEAETKITKDGISGLKVLAKYEDGSEKDITSYCNIAGDEKLEPTKTSKLKISFTDWNNKTHETEVNIKCTSIVKSLSANYNGSREGGTKISKGSSNLKVEATLDNGKKITVNDYEINGSSELQAGADNNYTITYAGASTNLTIKGKKSIEQVAESLIPNIKKNEYVTVEWFTDSDVYFENAGSEDEYDGFLVIDTWLDSGVYNYLSIAQTGSPVGLTYEKFLLASSVYCDDIKDEFANEGYDNVLVLFYVWPPGAVPKSGTRCYSFVSNEKIESNPFAN